MKFSSLVYLAATVKTIQGGHTEMAMDQIHGSGTTNPSKCIWHIMSLFNQRAKLPIRMTYRAVGSSTGQAEFLGVDNTNPHSTEDDAQTGLHWREYLLVDFLRNKWNFSNGLTSSDCDHSSLFTNLAHTDFGAGDIPISTEKYNALNASPTGNSAKKMVHLPFALSSVSFFYNLDGAEEIELDGCLLAKIFSRKITKWNDEEIVASNPKLADNDSEITVCRRTLGSSSTKSITTVSSMSHASVNVLL